MLFIPANNFNADILDITRLAYTAEIKNIRRDKCVILRHLTPASDNIHHGRLYYKGPYLSLWMAISLINIT